MIGIEERKYKFIKAVMSDETDENMLDDLEMVFHLNIKKNTPPCRYSVDELHQRTLQAVEEAREGYIVSHEEMKKRF